MASLTITGGSVEHAITRDDGSTWYAALVHTEGTVVVADSLTELVADLIDDYDFDDSVEGARAALDARYDFAVESVTTRQAVNIFAQAAEGTFNPVVESEEVLTALFAEKDQAVVDVEVWGHEMPLMLIATDYSPYTSRPAPQGNVQWIDPATELTLLLSLQSLGDFEFWVHEG